MSAAVRARTCSDGGPWTAIELFIEPPSHHFQNDRLFEPNSVPFAGDQLMAPYTHLRDVLDGLGVAVHTADLMPDAGEVGHESSMCRLPT